MLVVVVKGYPRVSETFIAQEIAALERHGLPLTIASTLFFTLTVVLNPYLVSLAENKYIIAGDLSGQTFTLHFVERLRGEMRFPDAASLIQQIGQDVIHARQALASDTTCALL